MLGIDWKRTVNEYFMYVGNPILAWFFFIPFMLFAFIITLTLHIIDSQ